MALALADSPDNMIYEDDINDNLYNNNDIYDVNNNMYNNDDFQNDLHTNEVLDMIQNDAEIEENDRPIIG